MMVNWCGVARPPSMAIKGKKRRQQKCNCSTIDTRHMKLCNDTLPQSRYKMELGRRATDIYTHASHTHDNLRTNSLLLSSASASPPCYIMNTCLQYSIFGAKNKEIIDDVNTYLAYKIYRQQRIPWEKEAPGDRND